MRNPREIKSESKPEIFQNLGDGTFYYNFDIQKIRIPFQDNETSILKDGFSYKQTRFSGIPQYKVVVESVIREYLTIDEEFDLINSYNKKVKSGASDIDADVTAYKEYSKLLSSTSFKVMEYSFPTSAWLFTFKYNLASNVVFSLMFPSVKPRLD